MENQKKEKSGILAALADWRISLVVLVIVIISELIGVVPIKLGTLTVSLLPMLFAIILGMITFFTKITNDEQSEKAEGFIVLAILPLVAKLGTQIGPSLPEVVKAGLALVLQEFGSLGTLLIALPVGLLLGFRRELIGMTHSVGREANVSLIAEKYGLDSPEGRGVMTIYVVGTLLGTIFYGLMMPVFTLIPGVRVEAWAMACGMGSGSMMAAASGALTALYPESANAIATFAGASQILTSATGLAMSILLALPLTNAYYNWLAPKFDKLQAKKKVGENVEG